MTIQVKHSKVSSIPDDADTSLVRPSDWNDDHVLTGTVPVVNGGTGVSTSSGANSVVLRDANANINANALDDAYTNTAASGTQIVLTVASPRRYTITGSGGQTIKLPDATTLPNGTTFSFNNNQSSGAISVNNNSNTLIVSIPSGAFTIVTLLSNSIAAGSWDTHDQAPANVSWSTNTFNYVGSITGATWNGNTVQVNRGGTGAATLTGLVVGNGTSAMTTVTAPSGTVVGTSDTQTLTNKTLTSPVVNTPVISGGTIDNAVIGGTTPVAGTFTTITGQTEVLKGTGQNLLVRSQEFDNASWGKTFVTVTANSTTAPDGSSTADTLAATSADSACFQSVTTSNVGLTYTFSVYLKADVATNISIAFYDIPTYNVTLAACAVTTSWQRFTVTRTLASGATSIQATIGGNSTFSTGETVYAWAAQVELGSTANTYIPTTTTAVYGTPTLSFSGVAGLGLQSDGSLYVSPAGTGALQAQKTDSTATGGNARGANAVDWQTSRNTAAKVASSQYSVIGGGTSNAATNYSSSSFGGEGNTASAVYSFAGSGASNTASGYGSSVIGGFANTAAGYWNVIGGGTSNSGTALAAVTTQSGTMNATTAVTLSGSNANIKVGQLITGTSIGNFTYVAAISGTSLTLSQAASGSSTSTLSFFTPHGVVVGGGNNQATGSYSFIGGGGDAGTAANRNVASGDWSFVGGGRGNTASAVGAFVGGGGLQTAFSTANQATGEASVVVGGLGNTATTTGASVLGGYQNNATGLMSSILGGRRGTTRSITGNIVLPACNIPIFDSAGTSQSAVLVLGRETTNATATVITSDANATSGTNQVILPNNSAYYFKIEIIAGVTGGGNTSGWELKGVIKRGANAAATAIVGTVTKTLIAQDAGASTWVVNATADTTNGGITVTVTGQASTTIRWVARCTTTEMTY